MCAKQSKARRFHALYDRIFSIGSDPAGRQAHRQDRQRQTGRDSHRQFHPLSGKDGQGGTEQLTGTLQAGAISGSIVFTASDDKEHPATHRFTATMVPQRGGGAPQRHDFTPTVFYRQFSAANQPVLTVSPGDTIHTTTVDAGGTDEKGVARVLGGNPETGPFYIQSAAPGDILAIHLTRLRLNRDWAMSDDAIVGRGLDSDLAVKMKDGGKQVRWRLDTASGVATPYKPGEHMAHYSVPLRPMLGCVAVAPGSA